MSCKPKRDSCNLLLLFVYKALDFSLDYVTLTFGSRREGSAPKKELNQRISALILWGQILPS